MPNKRTPTRPVIIPPGPSTAYVELTRGMFATIDREDAEWIGQHNWFAYLNPHANSFYAARTVGRRTVYLHRMVAKAQQGRIIDHRDRNSLNDCNHNLRDCTNQQNLANQPKHSRNTSGYKGVSYRKDRDSYRAFIIIDYRYKHLGTFKEPIPAALAYDAEAIVQHGQFACLNFPTTN